MAITGTAPAGLLIRSPIGMPKWVFLRSRGFDCLWTYFFSRYGTSIDGDGLVLVRNAFHSTWVAGRLRGCQQSTWAYLPQEEAREFDSSKEQCSGVGIDSASYASLLRWCGKARSLFEGKCIHAHMIKSGYERDRFLGNLLVEMYGKCGALEDGLAVFARMPERNVFSWTVMIVALTQHGQGEFALRLFQQMELDGVIPDKVTFVSVLSACASQTALTEGKRLHALIAACGLESDVFVGTALVNMYGKCGSVEDAERVFDKLSTQDVVSWTAMIAAYAQHGYGKKAIQFFQQMQHESVVPDKKTFIAILSACVTHSDLAYGKWIHSYILASGSESDMDVGNALINMYGKCCSLEDACRTFDKMTARNVLSWNSILTIYSQHGKAKEVLELFQQMQLEYIIPDKFTCVGILSACASQADISQGKEIHACIVAGGFESDVVVGTALVNMYSKCGCLQDAWRIFEKVPDRDAISWTAMIEACTQHGRGDVSLKLFQQMQLDGLIPDKLAFVSVLSACASQAALDEGKHVHARIVACGFELDVTVGNALVNMYSRCGSLDDARRVFNKMPERNAASWTWMISAYLEYGHGKEGLQLFQQMRLEGLILDRHTLARILSTFAGQAPLAEAKHMHAYIMTCGFELDIVVGAALVNMYGKCGSWEDARRTFDKMPERNVVSWNAMIGAYTQNGLNWEAFQLFQQMELEGAIPDKVTFISILSAFTHQENLAEGKWIHALIVASGFELDIVLGNALINMYGKCGNFEDVERLFNRMSERDAISWNSMIAACDQLGYCNEALQIFTQMELEGVVPDKLTFVSILSACASQSALVEGKRMHALIIDTGLESDIVVGNSLINMYGKCGSLEDAWMMFGRISKWDAVSWTAMISACAQHGQGKEALVLFQQMQLEGLIPNEVTFVSILFACSHAGMVDEGGHCFVAMMQDHAITPTLEHYNCMIDLLGRAGQLDEGENLINKMPYEPTAMSWMTVLGACRMHTDVQRGKHAAEQAFTLDPLNAAPYVLLSSIFAAVGSWDDAAKLRKLMEDNGLKKQRGCSSIKIKSRVHNFFVGCDSHPQRDEIHAELQRLSMQMEEAGYVPDIKVVLYDGMEHKKEHLPCHHSEKLAIAFGLINTPPGTRLHISKNLRVCPDCHSATKFISKIAHREILVRDSKRFHRFKDGGCSCADYW